MARLLTGVCDVQLGLPTDIVFPCSIIPSALCEADFPMCRANVRLRSWNGGERLSFLPLVGRGVGRVSTARLVQASVR